MMTLVPVAATYTTFGDILKSSIRSLAPSRIRRFESQCADLCEKRHAVYLSSLMRATYVACSLAKRLTGRDTVILPRYSCPSFTHGILAAGMKIRHCDLKPETLQIDRLQISSLFDSTVAALIVPNLFGLSSDLIALKAACAEHNALMIEGADYTFGGFFDGKPFGQFGDISILNFQEGKAIPIGGGMVISDHPILDGIELSVGRSPVPFLRSIAFRLFSNPIGYCLFRAVIKKLRLGIRAFSMEDTMRKTTDEVSYTFDPLQKLRGISHYQDSLGCQLLSSLEAQREVRRKNHADLCNKLKNLEPHVQVVEFDQQRIVPNMIRAPILVPADKRSELIEELLKAGFEASPMYCEAGLQVDGAQFPGAGRINTCLLTLPCNWYMNAARNEAMVAIITDSLTRENSCT